MPVRVNMPIRLRVEAHGLDRRLDDVSEAVEAALKRALTASRKAVLEPRGGYVLPRLRPPAVRWSGEPDAIAPELRAALETRITGAIDAAAKQAGVFMRAPTAEKAAEVLPDEIFEPFNPLHYDPGAGTYDIYSYQGTPKKKKASLQAKKSIKPPGGSEFVAVTDWFYFASMQDKNFPAMVSAAIGTRFGPNKPPPLFAVLFRMVSDAFPRLGVLQGLQWKRITTLKNSTVKATDPATPTNIDAAPTYDFSFVSDASEGSAGWERYRANILEAARKQIEGTVKKLDWGNADEMNRALDKQANDLAEKHVARVKPWISGFYDLVAPEHNAGLFAFGRELHALFAGRSIPVVSVTIATHSEVIAIHDKAPPVPAGAKEDAETEVGSASGAAPHVEGEGPSGGVKGGRGVASAPEYGQEAGRRFVGRAPTVSACEPHDHEPSISELGADGDELWRMIQELADLLDIPLCHYAGRFAIQVGQAIEDIAGEVTRFGIEHERGYLRPLVVGARDEEGKFYFEPFPSPSIQYLVYFAQTIPLLHRLINRTAEIMARPPYSVNAPNAWSYHFREKAYETAISAIKKLYLSACQICLLQLLNASRDNIRQRQENFDSYVKTFQVLVATLLSDQVELVLLQNALTKFKSYVGSATGEEAYEAVQRRIRLELSLAASSPVGYSDPKRRQEADQALAVLAEHGYAPDLLLRLADPKDFVQGRGATAGVKGAGEITQRADGAWVIRDSNGWDWTLDELTASDQLHQQYAQSMDPLVTQISKFVTEVKPLAEDPSKVEGFVRDLLARMMRKNDDVAADARAEYRYAFDHGIFHKDLTNPTVPGTNYNLSGIHLFAHQAIGSYFRDPLYVWALENLIAHELGKKAFLDDMLFIGTIAVSIICPPLGAAIGVATGIVTGISEYRHAKELEKIYESLFNPEEVLSRAEIEVQIFVAQLGLALSILGAIPEAKAAIKAASTTTKAILRAGTKGAVKRLAVEAVHTELLKLAEVFKANLGKAFAKALIEQKLQEVVVNYLLEEVIDAKIEALRQEHAAEGTP